MQPPKYILYTPMGNTGTVLVKYMMESPINSYYIYDNGSEIYSLPKYFIDGYSWIANDHKSLQKLIQMCPVNYRIAQKWLADESE